MRFAKAHGIGNDFLLVEDALAPRDLSGFAQADLRPPHRSGSGRGPALRARGGRGAHAPHQPRRRRGRALGQRRALPRGLGVPAGHGARRHTVFTVAGPRPVEVENTRFGKLPRDHRSRPRHPAQRSSYPWPSLPAEPVVDEPCSWDGETVRVTRHLAREPPLLGLLDREADDALVARLAPPSSTTPSSRRAPTWSS